MTIGAKRRCPECGFEFFLSAPPPVLESSMRSDVMTVVRVLLLCFAAMGVLVVVGIGVLYAGCALMMKH